MFTSPIASYKCYLQTRSVTPDNVCYYEILVGVEERCQPVMSIRGRHFLITRQEIVTLLKIHFEHVIHTKVSLRKSMNDKR
jgi:hypothetical protein